MDRIATIAVNHEAKCRCPTCTQFHPALLSPMTFQAVPASTSRVLDGSPAFLLAAVLLSLPMVFNPGYFSHDELQWLAFADHDSWAQLPWQHWFAFDRFQFRPVTFDTWLILSKLFGYHPYAMHAIVVGLGLVNAWLLRRCMVGAGVDPLHASGAALLFVLSPYAVQVHGWVGTLADIYCLMAVLLMVRVLQSQWRRPLELAAIALLTIVALWSKESAVVIPALLLVAWPWRCWGVAPAVLVSGLIVLAYLGLRWNVLTGPREASTAYAWSIANIPARVIDYLSFPFVPVIGENQVMRVAPVAVVAAGLLCTGALVAFIAMADWRIGALTAPAWLASLMPVLVLQGAVTIYGYLAAALVIAIAGWAYGRVNRPVRWVGLALAALLVAHGVTVVRHLRHAGIIQAGLYASLEPLLPGATPDRPIRIRAERVRDSYALQRQVSDIPSWKRIPMGSRVISVREGEGEATHVMDKHGHLTAVDPAASMPEPGNRSR